MKNRVLAIFLVALLTGCSIETTKEQSDPVQDLSEHDIIEQGKQLSMVTFHQLSNVLKQKMKEGGVAHAVGFCNARAYPIVDSIATVHQVKIKRTSDKVRNPLNAADSLENEIIQKYQQLMQNGEDAKPMVIEEGNASRYFAPIKLQGLCLSCHGTPGKHISESDYALIMQRYPYDKAIDYSVDELRGIWSITFLDDSF